MPTPTDERRELLTVVATMRARAGEEDELRDALVSLVEPTSREEGYVNDDLHEDLEQPGDFAFYEDWETPEHLDAHLATPHLVEFIGRIPDLLDVSVVHPDQRDAGTAQTAGGLHRWAAVSRAMNGAGFWMGYAVLDPGGRTGVHHHGEAETALFVVSGTTRWWVGDRLEQPREARAGDFVHIPAGVVHWEENASDTEPVEMVVVRSTQEAVVVNIDDHPHAPEHAR